MSSRAAYLFTDGPAMQGAFGVNTLPLTVVALIISYLDDDVTSLARLCRTSRVLCYMALPHIWRSVTLRSYDSIRYRDDLPEGFGSASPFSMGLNALVTRNVTSLVRSLTLEGEFGDADLHEYSRAGRISENGMILNIAITAAINRCKLLERFRWELNTRIQPNVYSSLGILSNLQHLWLRCPSTRAPQPTTEVPPMPNLRSFVMTHYDPLCFPDDVSTLLLHAARLQTLQLHFSPRMRNEGEPSVSLSQILRKNLQAKKKLHLAKIGLYNLLATVDLVEYMDAFDETSVTDFTALNSLGSDENVPFKQNLTYFIDKVWMLPLRPDEFPAPKSLRLDQLHKRHAVELGQAAGLERLYLVNVRYQQQGENACSTPRSAEASPRALSGNNRSKRGTPTPKNSLRDQYMDNICNVCGPTLKHLILPSRWPLTSAMAARLIRAAPNLTQLSMAISFPESDLLRMAVPSLPRLWALRILHPHREGSDGQKILGLHNDLSNSAEHAHADILSKTLAETTTKTSRSGFLPLQYVGVGPGIWEIGGIYEEAIKHPAERTNRTSDPISTLSQAVVFKRRVTQLEEKDVNHVEIWKMDSQDVV